jgi:membrane fusion protein
LFRQEVVDARRGDWLGTIVIAVPLSHWLPIMLSTALAIVIVLFLCFGRYTSIRHEAGAGLGGARLSDAAPPQWRCEQSQAGDDRIVKWLRLLLLVL